MPDAMDLQEITDWFIAGSTQSGKVEGDVNSGKVHYTFPNVFVTAPSQACPDREVKEDPKIIVQITQPNG